MHCQGETQQMPIGRMCNFRSQVRPGRSLEMFCDEGNRFDIDFSARVAFRFSDYAKFAQLHTGSIASLGLFAKGLMTALGGYL